MISYEPLYKTLKKKNISTYKLVNQHGISRSLLDRLKHNKPISTVTLNDLCNILHCRVEDVILFTEDESDFYTLIGKSDFATEHKDEDEDDGFFDLGEIKL